MYSILKTLEWRLPAQYHLLSEYFSRNTHFGLGSCIAQKELLNVDEVWVHQKTKCMGGSRGGHAGGKVEGKILPSYFMYRPFPDSVACTDPISD